MSVNPLGSLSFNARIPWSKMWASQSFSKGLHYWEVDVGACKSWAVGVTENKRAKSSQRQSGGQEKNSWILECDEGELSVLHNNDSSRVKESNIQTLGVFLDCDKGRVKFFNVNTGCILHSFITQFKNSVCPMFSICPQKDSSARLTICNLIQKAEEQYDSGNVSMASESVADEDMELSSQSSN